jgi:signal transduction histidine kinase
MPPGPMARHNAAKYTPQGGRIAVRVAREGEVTADSNGLGTGSVFTVTLKAAGPSVQDV